MASKLFESEQKRSFQPDRTGVRALRDESRSTLNPPGRMPSQKSPSSGKRPADGSWEGREGVWGIGYGVWEVEKFEVRVSSEGKSSTRHSNFVTRTSLP